MKLRTLTLFCLLGSPALVCAQTIEISAESTSLVTASVGVPQTVVVVPGPLSFPGMFSVLAPNSPGDIASARLEFSSFVNPHALGVNLEAFGDVIGNTPGHASSGPHELLLTVSSPVAMPITFELERLLLGLPGSPMPLLRVDFDDDGSFEMDETTASKVEVARVVGPAPLLIRCSLEATVQGVGQMLSRLRLTGTPGAVSTVPMQSGCDGTRLEIAPRFDGNLDYGLSTNLPGVSVAVIGLDTQPVFLGTQSAGPGTPSLPCVLLPRPDLIVALTPLTQQTLVVPPAARPVTLYTQVVRIFGADLTTSTAFQTYAF